MGDEVCLTPVEVTAASARIDEQLAISRAIDERNRKLCLMPLPDDYAPNAPHLAPLDSIPVYETPTGIKIGDQELNMSTEELMEKVGKMTALDGDHRWGGSPSMWAAQLELDPKEHAKKILNSIDAMAKEIFERAYWPTVIDVNAINKRVGKLVRKMRQWNKLKSKVKQLKRRSFWRNK